MGPKRAAEALVLRPGSRFKKDGFFEGLLLSMPSRPLQTDKTGCLGRKGCLCDGSGPPALNASVLRPLATLAIGAARTRLVLLSRCRLVREFFRTAHRSWKRPARYAVHVSGSKQSLSQPLTASHSLSQRLREQRGYKCQPS